MSVNGITNTSQTNNIKETKKTKTDNKQKTDSTKQNTAAADGSAAVYEKSHKTDTTGKIYKRDTETVERLKADSDRRAESLRKLVEKMLTKQGQTYNNSTDIFTLLREGKLNVDPETRAQAQKDIAEDGYWGVEQTSERMVSFAKALTGGDTSKADEMIEAVKKGFEQATKAWGDELPDISKRTLDKTLSKLEAWRDGKETDDTESMEDNAADIFTHQAATAAVAK